LKENKMLEGLTPPVEEQLCKVGRTAAGLSQEDHDILLNAVFDPRWSPEKLTTALAERGLKISSDVLRRHRKKACACAR
jgi:hypothetical protein